MDGSTLAISLQQASQPYGFLDRQLSDNHWFSTIPPERRGLHGEFDYYGLSKRVSHSLSASVNGDLSLGRIKVRQRGRVVVLSGSVRSSVLLHQVVNLVKSVEGVDEVETHGVSVMEVC